MRLIEKCIVDFLLVLFELFCYVLRRRPYQRKYKIFTYMAGDVPHQSFLHG